MKRKARSDPQPKRSQLAILLCLSLMIAGVGAIPTTSAGQAMDVNNVHCAHKIVYSHGEDIEAVRSGLPFHDHTSLPNPGEGYAQFRNHCGGIQDLGVSLSSYSVSDEPVAHIRAELYLGTIDPDVDVEGKACLRAFSLDSLWSINWECGTMQSSTASSGDPEWFSHNLHVDLPDVALGPEEVAYFVGFSDGSLYTDGEGIVNHYNGPSITLGDINDPGGGNNYIEADEFRSWKIHDPEGDDKLVIGGVPISMGSGSRFTFEEFAIEVAYNQSAERGGYEWRIRHTGDENRSFVWDDHDGNYEIRSLSW